MRTTFAQAEPPKPGSRLGVRPDDTTVTSEPPMPNMEAVSVLVGRIVDGDTRRRPPRMGTLPDSAAREALDKGCALALLAEASIGQ